MTPEESFLCLLCGFIAVIGAIIIWITVRLRR